jgi:hypothetical protein
MATYTERMSEIMYPLLAEYPDSRASGWISSTWVSLEAYHRAWLCLDVGDIPADTTVDLYLQQATTVGGLGGKAITGKAITQLGAGDDDVLCCIELQTEEMDVANNFDFIRVVCHINGGQATEFSWILYGCQPRYAPVPTTNWQEIVG